MIISLIGQDSYRVHIKLKEILSEYRRKHSNLSIQRYFVDDENWLAEFRLFFESPSLFGDIKAAIIFDINESTKLKKEDLVFIKNLVDSPSRHIILVGSALPSELDFCRNKPSLYQYFENLSGHYLKDFLLDELSKRNFNLKQGVVAELVKIYNGDCWGLINELDKLELGADLDVSFVDDKVYWVKISEFLRSKLSGQRLALLLVLLDHFAPVELFNIMARLANNKGQFAHYDILVKSGKLDYAESLIEMAIG